MAEWLIAPVLKTGIVLNKELSRVRIPLSPFSCLLNLSLLDGYAVIKGNGSARWDRIAEPEQKKIEKKME